MMHSDTPLQSSHKHMVFVHSPLALQSLHKKLHFIVRKLELFFFGNEREVKVEFLLVDGLDVK